MTAVDELAPAHPRAATPVGGWRLGLIGDPVAHSLSPAMHNAALRSLGIPGHYERWRTDANTLEERIASLRAPDILGANVTVPHKEPVIVHLDAITPLADRVGAVNTIVRDRDRLIGDNTDVYGFTTALSGVTGDLRGGSALVLGAGGASRAVVIGLEQLGLGRIVVANRNAGRAARLIDELDSRTAMAIGLNEDDLVDVLATAAVVVNATALGWHAGETPIRLDLLDALPDDAHVTDLTYRETDLLAAARARGLSASDGLEMLVLQGARALHLWTGRDAPVAVMRDAAVAARG